MAYSPGDEISSIDFSKVIGGTLDAVIKAQANSSMATVDFVKKVGFETTTGGEISKPIYVEFKYPKEVTPFQPAVEALYGINVVSGGKKYVNGEDVTVKIGKEVLTIKIEVVDEVIVGGTIKSGFLKTGTYNDEYAVIGGSGADAKVKLIVQRAAKDVVSARYQDMSLNVPILTMLPIPCIRVASTDIEFNVKINSMNSTSASDESQGKVDTSSAASYKSWWSPVSANVSMNASFSSQKKKSESEEIKKEFSLNIKIHAVQDEMPAGLGRLLDVLEELIVPTNSAKISESSTK